MTRHLAQTGREAYRAMTIRTAQSVPPGAEHGSMANDALMPGSAGPATSAADALLFEAYVMGFCQLGEPE